MPIEKGKNKFLVWSYEVRKDLGTTYKQVSLSLMFGYGSCRTPSFAGVLRFPVLISSSHSIRQIREAL